MFVNKTLFCVIFLSDNDPTQGERGSQNKEERSIHYVRPSQEATILTAGLLSHFSIKYNFNLLVSIRFFAGVSPLRVCPPLCGLDRQAEFWEGAGLAALLATC